MKRRIRIGSYFPVPSLIPIAFVLLLVLGWVPKAQAAPSAVPIIGEIEMITLNDNTDHYSGGTIVVGGQIVILPRNLLLDLPANRLTLKQLFEQAPATCVSRGETGLAKGDACNTSGTGGFATISANRSDFGNVIAGDVLIEKGKELVAGVITFINYNDGYYRLSGVPNVDNAGVIVRLNDPTARHTVQRGLGCAAGSTAVNCSPDPRFTLDPDNYTNSFSDGYPYCLPSTVSRSFDPNIVTPPLGASTAQSGANGIGDILCPDTNRPAALNTPAADSRRFAPLKIGDSVTAEGNFETIDNVTFLSAHTSSIGVAVPTAVTAGQPDYFTLAEVFMDAPAFYNQRYRTLIIGYTTLANPATDVLFWTIHRDKVSNAIHEVPWSSVLGCDAAGGAGSCSSQGLTGAGGNIFRIRHDIDFLLAAEGTLDQRYGAARANLSLCAMLRGEARFDNTTEFCPNALTGTTILNFPNLDARKDLGTGTLKEEFGIFSPIPHEIIGRTGRKVADPGGTIHNIDVSGSEATWGQYLFPFGVNLGGISLQEFNEIDLNLIATPFLFEGIPWNLDRRLGPGGCNGPCEADTGDPYQYALDPFPYSGFHPKTALSQLVPIAGGVVQGLPTGTYNDPNFTSPALTDVQNRMFSYVNTSGVFNGDTTVIPNTSFAPLIPPAFDILETPPRPLPPPLPANAVTLTAAPVGTALVGDNVTFTALASGGSGTYEYQFMAKVAPTGAFVVAQAYGPGNTWIWNSTGFTPGFYEVQVFARSVGSLAAMEAVNTVVYILSVPPTTSVGLTATPVSPGFVDNNVLFTATPTVGGTATHEYQFWYRSVLAPTFSMAQDYSAADTFTWKATAGSYEWKVFARSTGSTAVSEAVSPIVPFVVNSATAAVSGVTLTASPSSPMVGGPTVTFTAAASGGGVYEYQFLGGLVSAPLSIARPYSTVPTWDWPTAGILGGTYQIQVWVRQVGSVAPFEATQTLNFVVTTPTATGVTLTPSPDSPQLPGTSVTFTAAASGGGAYEYQFLGRLVGGTFASAQPYSFLPTYTWNTTGVPPGTYEIMVMSRAAGSSAAFDVTSSVLYGLSALTLNVTLTPSPPSPQTAGATVFFNAVASGGTGSYEYEFRGGLQGTTLGIAQPYGTGSSWTWPTTGVPPGTYEVQVNARSAGSTAASEATQTVVYVVN